MTNLIFNYYSTLKLRGSCLYWYVGFGSQWSFLAGDRKEVGVGGGGADLILLSSGAAVFRCVPATLLLLLLHLPFVYFKVRKKGRVDGGRKPHFLL